MEFRILGPLEVWDGEGRVELPRAKQRALLAALLLRHGEVVSVDRLLEDLWGEAPPRAAMGSLHNLVSALRKILGTRTLRTQPPGYVLDIDPEQLDLHRFKRLVGGARDANEARTQVRLLREALSLWRGRPLADIAFEPFTRVEITCLEELHLDAREDLVAAELAVGRHATVIDELERLIVDQPYRERPRALLMLALYRCGRQADALEALAATRRFLRKEVGLEPSPDLKKLQQAILRQDPALDVPASGAVAASGEVRRKTVSVVFTDIGDPTALGADFDPEVYGDVLRRYYGSVRDVLERHGGTVGRFSGYGVVGVFGVPQQHEDDALRAVRAAVELRANVAALNIDLERQHDFTISTRTGVNTGEAVTGGPGDADGFAMGHAVNLAAKLQQAAPPNAVLIGPATYALVRDAVVVDSVVPLALGRRTMPAFAVAGLTGGDAMARNLDAPLIGRTDELAALRRAFETVRSEKRCRVVTVGGEPGIGKSRLAVAVAAAVGSVATVALGRCVSYGEGASYLPLAEIVRTVAEGESEASLTALGGDYTDARVVARRVRELLGWAPGTTTAAEGRWAIRRLLEDAAARRPLLIVLEDIHWAEAALLDLVEHLAAHADRAPILVVCLARPELLDSRPEWRIDVALEPLARAQADELLRNLPNAADVADDVHARIVRIADGNPLYAEHLLAHVLDEGADALDHVPASLAAVLAARLERLDEPERVVVERAAAVGREFARDVVASLSGRVVDAELAELRRRGLILPGGTGELRFRHALIRDVAYGAITKERRAVLHERIADWLVLRGAADEIAGYHLEQAYHCRATLRRIDEHARMLARRAGDRLSAAGLRAFGREDAHAAINLLERALALVDDEERRAELLTELGAAHRLRGDGDAAARAFRVALEAAGTQPGSGAEARVRLELAYAGLYGVGDLRATPTDVLRAADAAIPVLEQAGDDRGLARAWTAVADARAFPLDVEAWGAAAARAQVHYERSGYSPAAALGVQFAALYWGPQPVARAIAEADALVRAHVAEPSLVEAIASVFIAGLEAMRNRFAVAHDLAGRARAIYDDRRADVVRAGVWSTVCAEIARLEGDLAGAASLLREACEALAEMKQHALLATASGLHADILVALEELDEAEGCVSVSRRHASADDAASQVLWRTAEARLAARAGDTAAAEGLAREALALVATSDALSFRAKTLLDAAEVFRWTRAGRGSAELIDDAIALYERKGNEAAKERAIALRASSASTR